MHEMHSKPLLEPYRACQGEWREWTDFALKFQENWFENEGRCHIFLNHSPVLKSKIPAKVLWILISSPGMLVHSLAFWWVNIAITTLNVSKCKQHNPGTAQVMISPGMISISMHWEA